MRKSDTVHTLKPWLLSRPLTRPDLTSTSTLCSQTDPDLAHFDPSHRMSHETTKRPAGVLRKRPKSSVLTIQTDFQLRQTQALVPHTAEHTDSSTFQAFFMGTGWNCEN